MKITELQSQLIHQLNSEFKTTEEISNTIGLDIAVIKKHLKNTNRKSVNSRNFYNLQLNHNYFTQIDTPAKAYILGVMASDGNIQSNMIRLRIHPKDIEIIDFFKKEVNYLKPTLTSKNSYGTTQVSLVFRSNQMRADLFKLGFAYNKTFLNLFIPLKKELMRFYILGLFDGDGSVFYTKFERKSGARAGQVVEKYRFSYTGNTLTGTDLSDYLKQYDIDLKVYPLKGNPKICSVQVSRNQDMAKLNEYLYSGHDLGLKRKRDLFVKAVEFYK